MTIYLITELYPVHEDDTSITHAIRDFAEAWDADVTVFRPLQLSLSNLKRFGQYYRLFQDSPRQLGPRKIVFFFLIKIPFLRKYFYWIKDRHSYLSPSVIVGHSLIGNYLADKFSKLYGVPFSAGLHNYDVFNLAKEKKQYEIILQNCSLIACRSYNIQKLLYDLTGDLFKNKTFVAHSGIEEDQVEDQSLFVLKAKELNNKKLHFITVARLEKSKNIDINIEVLAGLTQDYSYTIIGEGNERSKLQKQIDRHQLSDKIKILGWKDRSEVMEELKLADIFLMISAPETFGLAYLEAMAKACIVIGAYGWGIDGIVQQGQNGYLVDVRDREALNKVIHEILTLSSERREEIAMAARATVLRLSRQKAVDSYLSRLKRMLEE